MRKLYLLLALLLTFSSSAWADFHQPWTSTPFPWTVTKQAGDLPSGIQVPTGIADIQYRMGAVAVTRTGGTGNVTINFHYLNGGHALQILGVDLVDASNNVISSNYTASSARGNADANFTLSNVPDGSYTLRYWVYGSSSNSNNLSMTNGTITVTGLNSNYITSLDDLSNDKVYYFKSGRSNNQTSHYLYYNSAYENDLAGTQKHATTFNASDNKFHFALFKSGDTYYMYNIAAGKFVGHNSENLTNIPLVKFPSNGIKIKPSADMNYNWVLSTNEFNNGTLHMTGSTDHGVGTWTAGNSHLADGGNTYQIYEAGNLSADIIAAMPNWIAWGPAYNEVKWDVEAASDTRVTAITPTSAATINETLTAFETNPTTDNYNAMVTAHAAADRVSMSAGEKFTIKCVESTRGYMVYSTVENKGSEEIVNLAGTNNNTLPGLNENGVYKDWGFAEIDGKKYIYNVQNQKFIKKGTPVKFDEVGTFVEIVSIGNNLINIKFEGTNQYLSFSPGWGLNSCVRTEGSVDNGCKFYLDKTGETDSNFSSIEVRLYKASLDEKLAKGRLLGSGLGKYTYNGSENAATTIANAESVLASPASTKDDILSAISALEALYADFSLNQPVAGKLYRFKSYANTYLTSNTIQRADNQNYLLKTENATASYDYPYTLFYLTEDKKLLSYQEGLKLGDFNRNGLSNQNANNAWTMPGVGQAGAAFTFVEGTKVGTYKLRPGGNREICANQLSIYNESGKNYMVDAASTGQTSDMYNWTIEEATWLPIPISDVYKFATFYSPVDLAISDAYYSQDERLKFYTATIGTDGYVELKKVTDNIPAGKAYVVEYVEGSEYKHNCSYMKIAPSAPVLSAENALHGSYETVATPTNEGTIYTLQAAWLGENSVSENEVAFRQYNGATIQGFRAYLPVANNRQIAGMRIVDGDVTRIEGVNAEESHKVDVYDLSGRRVERATKGLYIINGKKVIVK